MSNFKAPQYPMHNEAQARYSMLLLKRDRRLDTIDEETYQLAMDRLIEKWPTLKVTT